MARLTNPEPSNSEKTLSKNPDIREIELLIRGCIRCQGGKNCNHLQNLKKLQKEENNNIIISHDKVKKNDKTMRKKL